jgi:hypothetical protein
MSASLRHGLGELVIVVAGVLIALWANAAWQNHTDRNSERAHLVALRGDFQVSLRLLDSAMTSLERNSTALRHLLGGDAGRVEPDSAEAWADAGLWSLPKITLQLGSLRDLEASGDLRLIQDLELRRGLADIDRRWDNVQALYADFMISQQRLIDPHLVEDLDLAHVLSGERGMPTQVGSDRTDWRVLETRPWQSRMAFKLAMMPYSRSSLSALREQVRLVLKLIDQRLAELGQPSS